MLGLKLNHVSKRGDWSPPHLGLVPLLHSYPLKISRKASKYRYDILTPGSRYRTIHWTWGQNIYQGGQISFPRWRHQMETFSALLALCEGNPPVTGGFPSNRPVTWNLSFFDVLLNKRLNNQWSCRRFEAPWCLCDVTLMPASVGCSSPHSLLQFFNDTDAWVVWEQVGDWGIEFLCSRDQPIVARFEFIKHTNKWFSYDALKRIWESNRVFCLLTSGLNVTIYTRGCYWFDIAFETFKVIHQNFKVTRAEKSTILNWIERFWIVALVQIHRWLWNNAQSLKWHRRGALLFFEVICQISRSHESFWTRIEVSRSIYFSFDLKMAMQWCTKLGVAWKRQVTILFFEVIHQIPRSQGQKKSTSWVRFELFRMITPIWIHGWLWNDTHSSQEHGRGSLLFFF